jgi:geranylgeranyl diphosphate synthase type I
LADLVARERARWSAADADAVGLFDVLAELLLAPAKRLRPAFCYWAFVGAGGDGDDDRWVDVAAALELLHAFALLHDDVMDGSGMRRGVRTAHVVQAERHTGGAWIGEARRFGEGVAILGGDLAFVYADELMSGLPAPAWAVWNELRLELNVGQYLDLLGTARAERRPGAAARIARLKSAKYTVERPLHLGALLAAPERSGELLEPLSRYGLALGDAFQLRDDMLGAFGDESVTGKPVGDDLREGKPTLLLALAAARARGGQRDAVARAGRADLTATQLAAIQFTMVDTGAVAEVECRIDALSAAAIAALDDAPLTPPARTALAEIARYVASRDS